MVGQIDWHSKRRPLSVVFQWHASAIWCKMLCLRHVSFTDLRWNFTAKLKPSIPREHAFNSRALFARNRDLVFCLGFVIAGNRGHIFISKDHFPFANSFTHLKREKARICCCRTFKNQSKCHRRGSGAADILRLTADFRMPSRNIRRSQGSFEWIRETNSGQRILKSRLN